MATITRHPSRLAIYSEDGVFYPRELTELDGVLYFTREDGETIALINTAGTIILVDEEQNELSSVKSSEGGSLVLPLATAEKSGIVKLASATPLASTSEGSTGVSSYAARSDHAHPLQTSVSGNAASADKLSSSRTITISGGATGSTTTDASIDIEIPITAIDATKVTGILPLSCIPQGAQERMVVVADTAARLALTADDVQLGDVVKEDDTKILYYVSNADALGTEDAFNLFVASTIDWSNVNNRPVFATVATTGKYADLLEKPELATIATTGEYSDLLNTPTIPTASSAVPSAPAANASAGVDEGFARGDHVHPLQTDISGNAGTATEFQSEKAIDLTGDVTGSASSKGGWNIAATLAESGVTAGSYGQSADASPDHGGTFTVPFLTVDTKGRITSASSTIITLPDASGGGASYTACDTSYETADKVCTVSSFSLSVGASVSVLFTYGVPADATLNISETGAKAIYHGSAAITDGIIKSNDVGTFIYDGTYWRLTSVSKPSDTYYASIGTTWSGTAAPYTQTIDVSGISANDNPIVDVIPDSTYSTAQSQLIDYAKIYKITTALNSITVYSTDTTTIAIPIQLKCVKS